MKNGFERVGCKKKNCWRGDLTFYMGIDMFQKGELDKKSVEKKKEGGYAPQRNYNTCTVCIYRP